MTDTATLPHSTYALSGLIKFRATIAGLIEQSQKRLETLSADLSKVDVVIKMIDASVELDAIRPKRVRAAKDGIGTTVSVLDALRVADGPLSARDLALKLIEARGQSTEDSGLVTRAVTQVSATFQNLRKQGTVEATKVGVGPQVWRLVD